MHLFWRDCQERTFYSRYKIWVLSWRIFYTDCRIIKIWINYCWKWI